MLFRSVTVKGAGTGGTTTLVVERAEDYHIGRPDETDFNGFAGETILLYSQTGEAPITINREDLTGILDDGASYRLLATVSDSLGQSSTAELPFEVHWSHQAVIPKGSAVISGTAAFITPSAPEGFAEGDTCDIYRLHDQQVGHQHAAGPGPHQVPQKWLYIPAYEFRQLCGTSRGKQLRADNACLSLFYGIAIFLVQHS